MAWPRGRSRKPQPQPEQQQPPADAEHKPALVTEPAGKVSEPKPDAAASKTVSKSKLQQAKAKDTRKPWRAPKEEDSLVDRVKAKAKGLEWRDRSSDDLLSLPEEAHQWLREQNLVAQWISISVLGQPQERHVAQFKANGWEPAQPGDIPGVAEVLIDGTTQLFVRSRTLHEKALRAQDDAAREPMRNRQQMLIEGVPGVTGSDHPLGNARLQ
jgi:hypothetical protein